MCYTFQEHKKLIDDKDKKTHDGTKKVINKERAGPHLTKSIFLEIKKNLLQTIVLVKFTALATYEDSMNCAERSWVQC